MTDPYLPAKERHLAKLQKHGGGRSCDTGIADRHKEDWTVAGTGAFKKGRIGTQQLGAGNAVYRRDLPVILAEVDANPAPDDHRGYNKTRSGDKIVETAEDLISPQRQTHLFTQFPESRFFGVFALFQPPTRQGPLAGMMLHPQGSSRQNQGGGIGGNGGKALKSTGVKIFDDTQGDGGMVQLRRNHCLSAMARHIGGKKPAKILVAVKINHKLFAWENFAIYNKCARLPQKLIIHHARGNYVTTNLLSR